MQEASTCWAFDMFKLAAATSNRPLTALGFFLMKVPAEIALVAIDMPEQLVASLSLEEACM